MRDLLSSFNEGWLEKDTKMEYHTNEAKWGEEGVLDSEMEKVTKNRLNKPRPTPTAWHTYITTRRSTIRKSRTTYITEDARDRQPTRKYIVGIHSESDGANILRGQQQTLVSSGSPNHNCQIQKIHSGHGRRALRWIVQQNLYTNSTTGESFGSPTNNSE